MKNRIVSSIMSIILISFCLPLFQQTDKMVVHAQSAEIEIGGSVFEYEEKEPYDIIAGKAASVRPYGQLILGGDIRQVEDANGAGVYVAPEGNVEFRYDFTDKYINASEEEWHFVEDKTKSVADTTTKDNILKGAVIVQTSKDGEKWIDDTSFTDVFASTAFSENPFYTTKGLQLINGCYYRIIVAYKLGRKAGENKVLFVKTKDYEYKRIAEVYQFYISDGSEAKESDNTKQKRLGEVTRAKDNSGYSGKNEIGIKDPHYGWELGQFYVSGYTRDAKEDDGNPVFLKNVGDQITLWFNLKQDIDQLNGDPDLSISRDKDGYDQYFQTPKTDMGRGTLIIRYTDEQGNKHDPEIYTNYLAANASTSADTVVKLFEEGDYEIALDYQVKRTPRKIKNIEVVPDYSDYRIYFKYYVRNGNCMVFPFDVTTGAELSDGAITPNGFKLDMARSRYLEIDVQRSVVTKGASGYTEDVRFNRPAKDGDSYTDEGIYVFDVKNKYTGEHTTKTIYVGTADYMKALSVNNFTVSDLNDAISRGGKINPDGTISR